MQTTDPHIITSTEDRGLSRIRRRAARAVAPGLASRERELRTSTSAYRRLIAARWSAQSERGKMSLGARFVVKIIGMSASINA